MAGYIEREELINQIRLMINRSSVGETSLNDISAKTICGLILEQPTADVVEVVRCKECKYFLHDTDYCKKHNAGYCEFDNQIKARLHFCGLAIKKEGAEEWLK